MFKKNKAHNYFEKSLCKRALTVWVHTPHHRAAAGLRCDDGDFVPDSCRLIPKLLSRRIRIYNEARARSSRD